MFRNKFEAKMYLKWLLSCDRNNSVSESFEDVNDGRVPLTSYEVIYNEPLLEWMVEESKDFEEDEWGIDRETLKEVLHYKIKECIYL